MARSDYHVADKMALAMGLNRVATQASYERAFPCIRLRGLPFHVTEDDIRLFLGCDTVDVLMMKKEGRFNGEAYVVLATPLFVDIALTKNKSYMGRRYIEIFRAKKLDYYRAVFAEMTEGAGHMEMRPRRLGTHGGAGVEMKAHVLRSTILKLRGLPFKVTPERVANWFHEGVVYETSPSAENVHLVADYGRPSGTAFVEFEKLSDAQLALAKDRQMMGTRYIEIFESSPEERARYTSH